MDEPVLYPNNSYIKRVSITLLNFTAIYAGSRNGDFSPNTDPAEDKSPFSRSSETPLLFSLCGTRRMGAV